MLYFLYGDGAPLMIKLDELTAEILRKNPGIERKSFDFSIGERESFLEAVSQNSIFSPKEFLIAKRFERLKSQDREKILKALQGLNLASKEVVVVYEEFFDEYDRRVDEVDKSDATKKKKLIEGFEKIGKVICYRKENQKKSAMFYLEKELNIGEYEAEKLLELIGEDLFKIKNEIEKIKNFLNGELYSLEKVKSILSVSKDYKFKKIFEKMLLTRNVHEMINYINDEREYFPLLYSLYDELSTIFKLRLLQRENKIRLDMSYNDFKDRIYEEVSKNFLNSLTGRPIHSYPLYLKFKMAEKYEIDELRKSLKTIGEIEYRGKSGEEPIEFSLAPFLLCFLQKND